jgi:hypothetical protein
MNINTLALIRYGSIEGVCIKTKRHVLNYHNLSSNNSNF